MIKKYTIAIFKHNKSNNLILLLLTIPISNFRGEKRSNLFGDCVFPTKTNHHKNRTLKLSLATRAVYLDKFLLTICKLTINVFFISTETILTTKRTQILLYPKYRSPEVMVLQKTGCVKLLKTEQWIRRKIM